MLAALADCAIGPSQVTVIGNQDRPIVDVILGIEDQYKGDFDIGHLFFVQILNGHASGAFACFLEKLAVMILDILDADQRIKVQNLS